MLVFSDRLIVLKGTLRSMVEGRRNWNCPGEHQSPYFFLSFFPQFSVIPKIESIPFRPYLGRENFTLQPCLQTSTVNGNTDVGYIPGDLKISCVLIPTKKHLALKKPHSAVMSTPKLMSTAADVIV